MSKSFSKILGFMIFGVCSYFAIANKNIDALQLGVWGSALLVANKTIMQSIEKIAPTIADLINKNKGEQ